MTELHPIAPRGMPPRHMGVRAGAAVTAAGTDRAEDPSDRREPLDETAFRQLRHQTKNALQRVLGLVLHNPALHATLDGQRLARELERRICLSAAVSDALFGLTRRPATMAERLRQLGESVIALLGDMEQMLHLDVATQGHCPPPLRGTVVRIAHELLGNTVKHGMHMRLLGHIEVRLASEASRTVLTVRDDGWGFVGTVQDGEGLSLARQLAAAHGGNVRLRRAEPFTEAEVILPHPRGSEPVE
ncbi:hypothetical protein M0638_05270 [Roseomonas sp. NAR14]|uniref:Histidine kinase/HSP90-like ATPase domain-containing protein n=1 Tax=Roseomonas acroporae TaxID=2937791 RepID=A0A9X2BT25_9PROT|nr:ATP-binding protein [Roseomonas acroporae]MCK8783792.1 hypothetical protein [Roseomonas acroporae]